MLTGYIAPDQHFIACPNQDVTYGAGFFDLDQGQAVIQVPDFGNRFWGAAGQRFLVTIALSEVGGRALIAGRYRDGCPWATSSVSSTGGAIFPRRRPRPLLPEYENRTLRAPRV
jgi:hypothetical protein